MNEKTYSILLFSRQVVEMYMLFSICKKKLFSSLIQINICIKRELSNELAKIAQSSISSYFIQFVKCTLELKTNDIFGRNYYIFLNGGAAGSMSWSVPKSVSHNSSIFLVNIDELGYIFVLKFRDYTRIRIYLRFKVQRLGQCALTPTPCPNFVI